MAITIDYFKDNQNHVLLNPRLPQHQKELIRSALIKAPLDNHIWLASSGTESAREDSLKIVAISKKAFFVAAESVCETFKITAQDVYLNTLPLFHVSGLSTLARAHVAGCVHKHTTVDKKWDAPLFCKEVLLGDVTLTSLVPTQIFDIVAQGLRAPPSLKFVFVGGGAIGEELVRKAQQLGWNLISTYGMTETAAMMAYKLSATSDVYTVLSHIQNCRTDATSALQIQSLSLFSGYFFINGNGDFEFVDPRKEGWFTAGDKAIVSGREIVLLGRQSELVKIKGESVSLMSVNSQFDKFCVQKNIYNKKIVIAVPDKRDGYSLCLVMEDPLPPHLLFEFNSDQLPFLRIARSVSVSQMPQTAMGKIDLQAVQRLVGS